MKKKDLIEQLVSEIETGRIRTLGIYGHGASGKSTFAQELYQALDSTAVNLLETRSLYHLRTSPGSTKASARSKGDGLSASGA